MKFPFKSLLVVAALGTFSVSSCSEKKADDAASTTENTASDAANSVSNAVDSAKADIARGPATQPWCGTSLPTK